ncbi:hypothetical protein L596_009636 [Steinernema carpocapsae]|uniref:Uncharacterized protein n=1 Tax=Steinernema carpocapsae TaxID=34508 RepID=A0A4U5PG82_STECR|nr:hypothetical protein L596_009636 [Steinernema carpocapsae]
MSKSENKAARREFSSLREKLELHESGHFKCHHAFTFRLNTVIVAQYCKTDSGLRVWIGVNCAITILTTCARSWQRSTSSRRRSKEFRNGRKIWRRISKRTYRNEGAY